MQDLARAVTTGGTVALWAGLCVQFVIRRGQPHREVLFATASLAVAITMVLPPVANSVPRIFGASGPCTLFQNIWGVLSSGLIFLVIAAGRGRTVTVAAAAATGAMMLTEGWLANVTIPPPAGWCLASSAVPASSLFWWLMISWHLSARAAALAVCLRDAAALRGNSWAQSGVWWYTSGFAVSTVYWTLAAAMLVTEQRWPQMDTLSDVLTGTVVAFTVAVWWPVAQRVVVYLRDLTEFWSLYRALSAQGWSAAERRSLWQESLHGWPLAPHRAAYRVRIAQADHQIERRINHQHEGELQ
jgi:hypothetical protein